MSHSLNEDDDFTTPVPTPDLFDVTYPSVVTQAFQAVTNRTRRLVNTLSGSGTWQDYDENLVSGTDSDTPFFIPTSGRADNLRTGLLTLGGKIVGLRSLLASTAAALNSGIVALSSKVWGAGLSQTYCFMPVMLHGILNDGTSDGSFWYHSLSTSATSAVGVRQSTNSASHPVRLFVPPLPINATIDWIQITCQGLATHGSITGMTMPVIYLHRLDGVGGVTTVCTATDISPDPTAYQTPHSILATSGTEAVAASSAYIISVTGEGGTNALNDSFIIYQCRIKLK